MSGMIQNLFLRLLYTILLMVLRLTYSDGAGCWIIFSRILYWVPSPPACMYRRNISWYIISLFWLIPFGLIPLIISETMRLAVWNDTKNLGAGWSIKMQMASSVDSRDSPQLYDLRMSKKASRTNLSLDFLIIHSILTSF